MMMRSLKNRGDLTRGRGINETVRTTCIFSCHRCASIHEAMTYLNGIEQHIELGASRQLQDAADLKTIKF